jgi:hypothetical protein
MGQYEHPADGPVPDKFTTDQHEIDYIHGILDFSKHLALLVEHEQAKYLKPYNGVTIRALRKVQQLADKFVEEKTS